MTNQRQIKVCEISAIDAHNLAQTFCQAVKDYYSDPENVRKFEQWEQQRATAKKKDLKIFRRQKENVGDQYYRSRRFY